MPIENEPPKTKKFTYFIGIDISKEKLDYAILRGPNFLFHRTSPNNTESIELFMNELKSIPKFTMGKAVFCMEQTGIYTSRLIAILQKFKTNIVLDDPLRMRNSMGWTRDKYDKIDAIRIAEYAERNKIRLRLWQARRPIIDKLMHLNTLRTRLISLNAALKTPLKEQSEFLHDGVYRQNAKLCINSLTATKADIQKVDAAIAELIASDERLKLLKDIITSIPCVGVVTAVHMIVTTNEFKDIRCPKKFASYSGVAPLKRESGKIIRRAKIARVANKKMKAMLHVCAILSAMYDKELKLYFERKKEEGKPKMSVYNAIRYKVILRVFACVNQERLFSKGQPVRHGNQVG